MKIVVWFGFVLGAVSVAGKIFSAKPGAKATLKCGVNGSPLTLDWHHKGELVVSVDRKGMQRKGNIPLASRSTLRHISLQISNVREEDAGAFTCKADWTNNQHTLAVISASANPTSELEQGSEVTLQCQVKGLSQSATVKWKRPDGTDTESGTVELKSAALSDQGTWTCVIKEGEENVNETLDLKVKELPKTTAPPTTQSSKNKPVPNSQPAFKLDWWVWVAIGVAGVIVVLLVVFVIVMCKLIRRKKKRNQKMKNGRWLVQPNQYCQCNRPTAAARPQQGRRKEKPTALPMQTLLIE